MPLLNLLELRALDTSSLVQAAQDAGVANAGALPRQQLVFELLRAQSSPGDRVAGAGVLEVLPDGFGFLRDPGANFLTGPDDVYVSPSQIRRFNLRTGDEVLGTIRTPKDNERYFALIKVEALNGQDPERSTPLRSFDHLTAVHPTEQLRVEHDPDDHATRLIDLFCPIGRGQRGLILAPPRSGSSSLLRAVARGLKANHPELHLLALLVDERPEEVSDARSGLEAEVVSTTFDEPPSRQVQVAELLLERAMRLVEQGRDVVLLLDSITRLARAYQRHAGHPLAGDLDVAAMQGPKRLFAAARKAHEGGSLTVLAIALTDTGAKVDELVHQELAGAGNLELRLNREQAWRRMAPAIDLMRSGTRHDELLLDPLTLARVNALRAALQGDAGVDLDWLGDRLAQTSRNQELLDGIST